MNLFLSLGPSHCDCPYVKINLVTFLGGLGCVGAYMYYLGQKGTMVTLTKITGTAHTPTRIAPEYKNIDAGIDVYCDVKCTIMPGKEEAIETGITFQTSHGQCDLNVRSYGVCPADCIDYVLAAHKEPRELFVLVRNSSDTPLCILPGQKIGRLSPTTSRCMLEI